MRKMIQILRTMTMMMMKMKIKKDIYMHIISYFQRRMISYIMCVCTVSSFLHPKDGQVKRKLIFLSETYTHFVYYIKITIAYIFFYTTLFTSTRHSHFDHPILIFYNFFFTFVLHALLYAFFSTTTSVICSWTNETIFIISI